jgi:hypothetical protein
LDKKNLLRHLAGSCATSGDFVATAFFDAGAGRQALGSGHEDPNFVREPLRIGSSFVDQGTDERLANRSSAQW